MAQGLPVALVPVLLELKPCDFTPARVEDWAVCCALFSRRELVRLAAFERDDVHLLIRQFNSFTATLVSMAHTF